MEEIWKAIKGYEKYYEVSNLGNVRSFDRVSKTSAGVIKPTKGRLLNLTLKDNGYKSVMLSVSGKTKRFHVHRLVAIAFIDNPESKPQVNHKNGIKSDNALQNLEWMTKSENARHAINTHLTPIGQDSSSSKLTDEKVIAIRRLYRLKPNFHKLNLSIKLGVADSTIHKIIRNQRWKHLTI